MKKMSINIDVPARLAHRIEQSPVPLAGRFLDYLDQVTLADDTTPNFKGLSNAEMCRGFAFMLRAGIPLEHIRFILDRAGMPTAAKSASDLISELSDRGDPKYFGIKENVLAAISSKRKGFCGGWVSSVHLLPLVQDIPNSGRRDFMATLGYDWHPALTDGRVNNAASCDGGKKARLYVKAGHESLSLKTAAEVLRAYEEAQK